MHNLSMGSTLAKWSLLVLIGLVGGLWILQERAHAQTAKRTKEPLVDVASIDKKLQTLLENQQLILQKFNAVMEELRIVKIRCTD